METTAEKPSKSVRIDYRYEPTWVLWLTHFLVGLAFKVFGWGPEVEGLEHLPKTGRVIVACNHRHFMDTMLLPLVVLHVRPARGVGKEELFRNPVIGWFFRQCGIIKLDRSRGDISALKQSLAVLDTEACYFIFPEGTRSKTGERLPAKAGLGFLAYKSGAPVVPARVINTELFPKRVRMKLKFGPATRYEGDGSRDSCQAFAERVLDSIYSL